ncbi:vWA containing CoxE family protein [Mycobacterium xenopi 3993]|nr:vWA containing CoxE family protein [Mycobacterium xenopi 3993]
MDAGRVVATLGLSDREVLREGIACAVLRRPDHRETYDAMFDLWWPAALGARAVVTDETDDDPGVQLPPDDVEAMRQMLVDLLTAHHDLADMDERLVAMIAQIVEAYGKYSSSRGPSYSSYQALKAMALDQLEGRLLAGLLAPYGDQPTPPRNRSPKLLPRRRSRSCAGWSTPRPSDAPPNSSAATTSRCTASHSFPRTSSSCEPQLTSCARCAVWWRHWPAPWPPGWPPAGVAPAQVPSTCAKPCASRCPPAVCPSTWCCVNRARPGLSWWCCATCPARWRVLATSLCC